MDTIKETSSAVYMTANELAEFLHISKAQVYQLTHAHKIPFYSPTGRRILFKRTEMIAFAEQNRVASTEELLNKAQNDLMKKEGCR